MKKILPFLTLACAMVLTAVTVNGTLSTVGLDVTGTVTRLARGTSPPGTCSVGDVFFDTDATAGSNWLGCTASNTWTAQGGSGGSAAYFDSLGCYRIPVGTRYCEFYAAGTIQSAVAGAAAIEDIIETTTDGTSGDKIVINRPVPKATFSTTTLYVKFRSTSTSTVTFTARRACTTDGSAMGLSFATQTAVDVTPGASGRTQEAVIPMTSCSTGELMNTVVATNGVAIGIVGVALKYE